MNSDIKDILEWYYCHTVQWFRSISPETLSEGLSPVLESRIAANGIANLYPATLRPFITGFVVPTVSDEIEEYIDNIETRKCTTSPAVYHTFKPGYADKADMEWFSTILDNRSNNKAEFMSMMREAYDELNNPKMC